MQTSQSDNNNESKIFLEARDAGPTVCRLLVMDDDVEIEATVDVV